MRQPAASLLLALCLPLCACSGSDTTGDVTAASGTPSTDATAPGANPAATPDDAQRIAVTVAGGKVTGDTGRVPVKLGSRVRLTITADVADEVHVHGVDKQAVLSPGQATELEFVASPAGIYEVELHKAELVLLRLQIS